MNLEISAETAKKIIRGLDGDKHQRKWALEFLKGHITYHERNEKMYRLAEEWLRQYMLARWDDPIFENLKNELLKTFGGDRGAAVDDEVYYLLEGVRLAWNNEAEIVIWDVSYSLPLASDLIMEMLVYINEHFQE